MKPNPIALIVLFAILVLVALRTENRFAAQEGRFLVREEADAVVFMWRDDISFPMSARLAETFDEWRDAVGEIVIDLSSPGGSVAEGRQVIAVIDRMKETHRVSTHVGARGICMSMCVPIYLQGEERTASPYSRWMFHEPSSVDAVTGERVDRPAFERAYETRRFVDRYFRSSDMDPAWLAALEEDWKGRDIRKSGRDLVAEGSGVIQRLE